MSSDTSHNGPVDRRSFLAASAAGAVVAATAPTALAKRGASPLKVGTDLGAGWVIASVGNVEAGAIRVVVEHADTARRANVALCKAEASGRAMATAGDIDLFLMNDGGNGQRLTPDDEVAMVQRFARRLDDAGEIAGSQLLGRQARQAAYDPIDHLEPLAR